MPKERQSSHSNAHKSHAPYSIATKSHRSSPSHSSSNKRRHTFPNTSSSRRIPDGPQGYHEDARAEPRSSRHDQPRGRQRSRNGREDSKWLPFDRESTFETGRGRSSSPDGRGGSERMSRARTRSRSRSMDRHGRRTSIKALERAFRTRGVDAGTQILTFVDVGQPVVGAVPPPPGIAAESQIKQNQTTLDILLSTLTGTSEPAVLAEAGKRLKAVLGLAPSSDEAALQATATAEREKGVDMDEADGKRQKEENGRLNSLLDNSHLFAAPHSSPCKASSPVKLAAKVQESVSNPSSDSSFHGNPFIFKSMPLTSTRPASAHPLSPAQHSSKTSTTLLPFTPPSNKSTTSLESETELERAPEPHSHDGHSSQHPNPQRHQHQQHNRGRSPSCSSASFGDMTPFTPRPPSSPNRTLQVKGEGRNVGLIIRDERNSGGRFDREQSVTGRQPPRAPRALASRGAIFITNLSRFTTRDDVAQLFGKIGTIDDIWMPTLLLLGGRSVNKGYARVTYASAQSVGKAISSFHRMFFNGQQLGVAPNKDPRDTNSNKSTLTGSYNTSQGPSQGPQAGGEEPTDSIWFDRMSPAITLKDLEAMFGQAGRVIWYPEYQDGTPKGFGKVWFDSVASAHRACLFYDRIIIYGSCIKVVFNHEGKRSSDNLIPPYRPTPVLYLYNLSRHANEKDVVELVGHVASVRRADVIRSSSGASEGKAIIELWDTNQIKDAVKTLHGHRYGGQNLVATLVDDWPAFAKSKAIINFDPRPIIYE